MKGFIVYPTYRGKGNETFVHLYGRLENGETFLTINKFRPYFFIKKKDRKKADKIAKQLFYDVEETELLDFNDNPVVKILMDNPQNVSGLRDMWHEEGIDTYESDIRFTYRFMIDKDIKGSMEIEGDFEKGDEIDRIYTEPELSPTYWTPNNLKVLAIDIETDKDAGDLWAISLYTDDYKNVLINKKGKFKGAESLDGEKAMLERFKELIKEIDPDIITGWNVIDFDFDFLENKYKKYKIPFDLGRTSDRCKLRRYESFWKDSSADFPGRQVLDGMHLMRASFIQLEDGKLDTAAKEYVGEGKLLGGFNKYDQIKDAYLNKPQKLIDYNLQDSFLAYEIVHKSGTLALTIQRSLVTGMQLDRVGASVASLDRLYLAEIRKKGYVCPSRRFEDRERRILGGYVMEGKPGIYDYVIVCDFKSLYPSIMRTFNIDPWAFARAGKKPIKAPNGAKFSREIGLIPEIIQKLYDRRLEAKKDKNELESFAIKTLMNSMFGVLANPSCRFYSYEMANAITHFGQHFIKLTAEKVEEKGYKVIYSDTDSVFIDLEVDNHKKAKKIGKEIEEYITGFFKEHIKKKYGLNSYLDLDFQKVYKRFLMPKLRTSDEGAKKRYAGLEEHDDGSTELDFVGLEFVRRDWTDLSKNFQMGILDRIFKKEDPTDFIQKFVEDLKKGKFDNQLIYRKALRKEVEEYTKTTPPHVKAAMKMKNRESNIIEYIITSDGPEPADDVKHSIDYDHYIAKQLEPIADAVLHFYGTSFGDVLKGSTQSTLSGF